VTRLLMTLIDAPGGSWIERGKIEEARPPRVACNARERPRT
jgi:hypothetical protein